MKAVVAAFNQEKALVGAFSVIVQPVVEPMEHYTALIVVLHLRCPDDGSPEADDDGRHVEEVGVGVEQLRDVLRVGHTRHHHRNPGTCGSFDMLG